MRGFALLLMITLGGLFWLASIRVWAHPVYRFVLMLTLFAWCSWIVRAPTAFERSAGESL